MALPSMTALNIALVIVITTVGISQLVAGVFCHIKAQAISA